MALARDLSDAQLAFLVAGGDVDQFLVTRYRGREGLCQLYHFEIELVTSETQVSFDDLVGKAAVFSVNTAAGQRWFHGIVRRFEVTGQSPGQILCRAELVPAAWLLTQRYSSRIFQQKSVQDIITAVLEQAGFSSDTFRFNLTRSYSPREYCVQYRETDYNFVCRLMEEEGIWWYVEQSQDGHVLVMADSESAYAPLEGDATVPFVAPGGMVDTAEHVSRFQLGRAVRPGKAVLSDFNFENPALNLEASSDAGRDTGLEHVDYPGEYREQSVGTSLAQLRVQEFDAARTVGQGCSSSPRLAPGRTFSLSEHPLDGLNGDYLVIALEHRGGQATTQASIGAAATAGLLSGRVQQVVAQARSSDNPAIRGLAEALAELAARVQRGDEGAPAALRAWAYHAGQVSRDLASLAAVDGEGAAEASALRGLVAEALRGSAADVPVYECRFECVPSSVVYRPPRVTPWPVMRGTQTARVVGPSGEEIHTDQYGRVKVRFNWDRAAEFNENASCWIRVAQGMAGGSYGMMFLPRVGQEVIVDFLEGNPDQPIIVGRVYNADQMPPYTLPDEKTKSVIKTHSSKGGGGNNEIRFEDLKDSEQLFIQAQRQMDTRVKADHLHTVGGSYHLTVGGEKDGALSGEYRQLVFKARHVHVKGEERTWTEKDVSHKVDGKVSIKVAGTHSTSVDGDVVEKLGTNHKHEVAATYALKATSIKLEAASGIEIKCGGSSIVLTPSAIFIVGGPLVNINSGSGAPVTPPSAAATTPQNPEDPTAADSSQPGADVTYSGSQPAVTGTVPGDVGGWGYQPPEEEEQEQPEAEEEQEEEKKKTWVKIQLVNAEGEPVPSEHYRITSSDGQEWEGTTDANGMAEVQGLDPDQDYEVTFPDMDESAWHRED